MTDIVDKLNEMIATEFDGSPRTPIWREAVAEIKRLRMLAGAVTSGPSLAQIKATVTTRPVDPAANEHSA